MTIFILQHLAQSDEWLNISSRAHHLDDDVEGWRKVDWLVIVI